MSFVIILDKKCKNLVKYKYAPHLFSLDLHARWFANSDRITELCLIGTLTHERTIIY